MRRNWYLLILLVCLLAGKTSAQNTIPMSVKELAPDYGIRPSFLDDTIHLVRYLDSLNATNTALTDSCVAINAKLMAMENILMYDYRHDNDTVWIDATHYLEDYNHYTQRISDLSKFVLDKAHYYIEREHIRQDNIQQTALNLKKDTIDRQHRTIVNACEGIGITDKDRKKDLKDIYYAYLSVYNRYDLSMKRNDSAYTAGLTEFCQFQKHLIDNLLSNNSYSNKINNFTNTLKMRCGHTHSDVLRSYQRAFRQPVPSVTFTNLKEYYKYIGTLDDIQDIQNSYLTVIDLREKITATNKRITSLYYPKFHDVAKTYDAVAATINTIPAFNTSYDAHQFIATLQEFIQVQDCYLEDYNRLMSIQEHGDTIARRCSLKYSDIAKAYKKISDVNSMTPNYLTLDDAVRFGEEMNRFEVLQRQYDTIILLRQMIDSNRDSITKGWMSHMVVYNGFQNIRKQYVSTPTFIDIDGGSQFINQLMEYNDMELRCIKAIKLYNKYKQMEEVVLPEISNYRNIRKAYNTLEKLYITIKAINHLSELMLYSQQLDAFITVQNAILAKVKSPSAEDTDNRLKNEKDTDKIEILLGL